MKVSDAGYWAREKQSFAEMENREKSVKEAVAFALAMDVLKKETNLSDDDLNFQYSRDSLKSGTMLRELGSVISKAKGLTIDDASPDLKKALLTESKEMRDMYIGAEYFLKLMKKQEKRVSNEDVKDIDYNAKYIDVSPVVERVKKREQVLASRVKGNSLA